MNLVSLSDRAVAELGEKLILIFEGREYTNIQLYELSKRLASGLKSIGIGRGDHVAVSLANSPEVFACFQAIWRLGAVIVPVMFLLGENETRYILEHCDAKAVITSQDLLGKINQARQGLETVKKVVVLGGRDEGDCVNFEALVEKSPVMEGYEEMAEDDLALMIYTSGTTGRPKGVMLTHNNLYSNAVAAWEANEWDHAPVSLICLPLAHSFGVVTMNAGNLNPYKESYGVLMRWFDPEEIFRLLEKYRPNNFIGVSTMYQVLLHHPAGDRYDTSSLERCTISAAPVTEELYRAFIAKFNCQMYEGYGLTEASPAVALCRPNDLYKKGSCGRPIPGVEVRIVDFSDTPLPPGQQGEILVRGPNVMKGYYKDPAATQEALRGGWLHTGDVGYLDEENFLYITDRMKDMIIKGGYNIYPSEIEGYLVEHPAVQEASVIGIPDEKYGEEVMAFVIRKTNQNLSEEEIISFAQSRMTKFKCPARVTFIEALPKTLVGKVDKKQLRKMA